MDLVDLKPTQIMYKQEITRRHRTAFVIAIDQSRSMAEMVSFNGSVISKALAVTYISDQIIHELTLRARRDDGVRDYFDVAVLGYSNEDVYPLIDDKRFFIPISELPNYKPEIKRLSLEYHLPNGQKILRTNEQPSWIRVKAEGDTPMYEAMLQIRDMVSEWCNKPQNHESFPPIIFNITDGECSDCSSQELIAITEQIRNLGTSDGKALLINVHIASRDGEEAIIFPSAEEIDKDNRSMQLLAECSSIMPEPFNQLIRAQRGNQAEPPFIAMSYNASITEVIAILNIGSRSVTNLV